MSHTGWKARVLGTLVLAPISWVLLGYFATLPLGAIYGWGGHPAIPSAPLGVYIALYGVVFPLACLAAAWFVMGRLIRPDGRRSGTSSR